MTARMNRQWLLARRPSGEVGEDNFQWHEAATPDLAEGQYLVQTIYLSVDPTQRGWMTDRPSYIQPVGIGEVMRAYGVGKVVASRESAMPVGTLVSGMLGFQDFAVGGPGGESFNHVPPRSALKTSLSVFSITGMTAYFGLLDVGRPMAGETVVVSGAAGATGSIAGQIAKIKGCRVVGIAGSDEKCAWVRNDLGFDDCINYRTENVGHRLRETCPAGIDVYFDNVGGEILDVVLAQIRLRARIVLCGYISVYNLAEPPPGPRNLPMLIGQRARMEGFLIVDYMARFPEAAAEMGRWMAEGRLKSREQLVEGLENAPKALAMLFEGGNTGKLLVQVSPER